VQKARVRVLPLEGEIAMTINKKGGHGGNRGAAGQRFCLRGCSCLPQSACCPQAPVKGEPDRSNVRRGAARDDSSGASPRRSRRPRSELTDPPGRSRSPGHSDDRVVGVFARPDEVPVASASGSPAKTISRSSFAGGPVADPANELPPGKVGPSTASRLRSDDHERPPCDMRCVAKKALSEAE